MPGRAETEAAELLKRPVDEWNPARVERNLSALHRRSKRRRLARVAAVVSSVVVVALAGAVMSRRGEALPAGSTALRLDDGSVIVSRPETRFRVRDVSAQQVRVALDVGFIDVEVTPRPEREFVVEAGDYQVVVLGTRFEVVRDGPSVRVHVLRGVVRVQPVDGGPGEKLGVGADRTFVRSAEGAAAPPAPPAVKKVAHPMNGSPSPAATAAPSAAQAGLPTGDWRPLARRGVYDEAFDLLAKQGDSGVSDQVDDLLLASDAARLSGHPAEALPYLERLIAHHGRDERAPMAAFTKGRLLGELGKLGLAGGAYETAMELGAEGSLRENALAHAVEAYGKSGNRAKAERLARDYVQQYPQGRWLSLVRAHSGAGE